jgi:hypothetical protein
MVGKPRSGTWVSDRLEDLHMITPLDGFISTSDGEVNGYDALRPLADDCRWMISGVS